MNKKLIGILMLLIIILSATGCSGNQNNSATTIDQSNKDSLINSPTPLAEPSTTDGADSDKQPKVTVVPSLSPEEMLQKTLTDALETITIPNPDNIKGNITLCKTIDMEDNTYEVSWSSSDETTVSVTASDDKGQIPAGVVTRGDQDKKVILTAEIKSGDLKVARELPLIVKAKPEATSYGAYLYCYFQDNIAGKGQTQQIFLATSTDGLRWKALNDDMPVLTSTMGTKGVRDPFLLRSREGDKFYILATDLDANGGDWGAYSTRGSRNIVIWESEDLVHWSEERLVDISPRNAECMWAPEAYYDEVTGQYVVYWSASLKGGNGKKIYYATTRDFYTFSQPKVFKDVERNAQNIKNGNGKIEANLTFIDTTLLGYNNKFFRFTKREIDSTILMEASDKLLGPYSVIDDVIGGEKGVEGPSIFQLNGEEKWILMVDGYAGKGYFPMMADSLEKLETGHFVRIPRTLYQLPKGARHGSFLAITTQEYNDLMSKWGQ